MTRFRHAGAVLALAALPLLYSEAPAQPRPARETAVLAGGCFWGMEAVFEHVKGVTDVVSGYAGGSREDARYDAVSSEHTAHAEAIQITYDPRQVSFAELLDVYFTVAHDPTQLNRQGPDRGPSYRSAIFPRTAAQMRIAIEAIKRLKAQKPVVTRIEQGKFFAAEPQHQDFIRRNPAYPYVVINDLPKLEKLRRTRYWRG